VHPVQKEKLGVRLLLVGELWFLFSLIWSPPLFQFVAITFRWVRSPVVLWFFFLDFVLAGGLIISGLILLKASRSH